MRYRQLHDWRRMMERAKALIALAHPEFHGELAAATKEMHLT